MRINIGIRYFLIVYWYDLGKVFVLQFYVEAKANEKIVIPHHFSLLVSIVIIRLFDPQRG